MKILQVLRHFPFGGAQRIALDLAHAQSASGHDVRVLLCGRDEVNAERVFAASKNLDVLFCPGHPFNQARFARSVIHNFAPDIMHLHLAPPWLSGVIAVRRRYGLLAHLHTRPTLQVHRPTASRVLAAIADGVLLSRCDRLIAVSEWASNSWAAEYPWLRPEVIHNGVNLCAEPQVPRRSAASFTIGIAVRLSERKGMEEFLDLATAIHRRNPTVRFVVAGDGPMSEAYRQFALTRGLAGSIEFLGFVSDIEKFWRSVDCAAFMSSVDTFGLGIIEPASQGRPVLAYRTGTGADEVIALCRSVESVPYADTEALAEIAVELANDPGRRRRMAAQGLDDCRAHFSLEVMNERVEALYSELHADRSAA